MPWWYPVVPSVHFTGLGKVNLPFPPTGLAHRESNWESTYWDICVSAESLPFCPVRLLPVGSLGGTSSTRHLLICLSWLSFSCCDAELRDMNTSITRFNNPLNKLDPYHHQMPCKRRYVMNMSWIFLYRFSTVKLIFILWYNKSF